MPLDTPETNGKSAYYGKILNGNFSQRIKDHLKKAIPIFHAFDQAGSPAIPYISAWQESEKNIWYEFISRKFMSLLDCGPANIPQVFRSAIIDRRVYKSNTIHPHIVKEVSSREELNGARETIREESEKIGRIEAVYKLAPSPGNVLWLKDQATIVPFPEDDTSLSFGCLTTVTKEMAAEEERQRLMAEKIALENRLQKIHHLEAIGNLAEGIAQNLNIRIAGIEKSINTMLESLGHDYHGDTRAFQDYQNMKSAEQQIKDVKNLANQLLAFAGRGSYNFYETDLNEIVRFTAQEFRLIHPDIEMDLNCQENLSKANVDRAMIGRALLNIYQSITQRIPAQCKLRIETKNTLLDNQFVEPFSLKPGDFVMLQVEARDLVLDETERERALEPFYTGKAGPDTGLRMASVFGIVKKHGGIITIAGDADDGTSFAIYLPAAAHGE